MIIRAVTIFIIIMLMFYNGRTLGGNLDNKGLYNSYVNYSVLKGVHIGNKLTPDREYVAVVNWDIDPSYPRFFVISLKTNEVVYAEHTSHGVNTGTVYNAKYFSNVIGSKKSSLGVFRVSETYYGKYGYSARLDGITKGVNNNIRKRNIVLHPSYYVSDKYVGENKYPGRSHGCITIPKDVSEDIIDMLKDGSLIINIYNNTVLGEK